MKNEPAFPVIAGNNVYSHGMWLRDYFAAKALPTIMVVCANDTEAGLAENITKYFAKKSYEMADAMLAEREKS